MTTLDPHGRLKGVNPRLIAVIQAAHAAYPHFRITCGMRTKEEQKALVAKGASQTMNSRHLKGDAVDVVAIVNGKVNWDLKNYTEINKHVQKAAKDLGERVTWGGSWKSFVDGPHFQIEHG